MRHVTLLTALYVVGFGSLQAVAADLPAAAAPDAPKAAAPAAEAASTSTLAPAAPVADPATAPPAALKETTTASGPSEEVIKRMRSRGYKVKVQNGNTYFCRSEQQLGSKLERPVCGTAEQLDQAAKDGQDMARDLQRNVPDITKSH